MTNGLLSYRDEINASTQKNSTNRLNIPWESFCMFCLFCVSGWYYTAVKSLLQRLSAPRGPDEAISKHIHALTPSSFFIIHNSKELIGSFRRIEMGCITCLKYIQLLLKIQQGWVRMVDEFISEACWRHAVLYRAC